MGAAKGVGRRGGGWFGVILVWLGASTCRRYIRNLKRVVVLLDGVCVGLVVGRPQRLFRAGGVSCGMFVQGWVCLCNGGYEHRRMRVSSEILSAGQGPLWVPDGCLEAVDVTMGL